MRRGKYDVRSDQAAGTEGAAGAYDGDDRSADDRGRGGAPANDGLCGRCEKAKSDERKYDAHTSVQADLRKLSIPCLIAYSSAISSSKFVWKRTVGHDRNKNVSQLKRKAGPAALKDRGGYRFVQKGSKESPRHDEIE